ncbi:type I restriction endonuclease subunit R [Corynebacterium diphtheriae]|uniref:type I restriction endonuclease subunit R n=1 Tax=Corynebacterium diphtheriae TaxID=1717 RepID=UPI0013CBF11B|nr:type I restriction endonuclease [Corynebacterium diphtheriae]MBG9253011.1 type I restriction endonuclease subunit R [Corynebacterium diphtheriae bv. mitis]CAB0841255.1 type I restriction endonuclease subunit R [Corynebacterium diphtheriae]CAB0875505.1 type I restriction endonuclease subunit R [Corynebacterium diphtheriae]
MGVQHEKSFETEICEFLGAHGWLYEEDFTGYDQEHALIPEDVFAWLQETQPEQWARVMPDNDSPVETALAQRLLVDRLVKELDQPLEHGGGLLAVLRGGFRKTPAKFFMCAFKPATSMNPEAEQHYQANRLRVVRQVHHSAKRPQDSIDLVFFVNGLPVATAELKTDNTQSIDDAVRQYRRDRVPQGEPLLKFGSRALVHFAVSTDEIRMTTKLDGADTVFLPFNLGNDGGAGNPLNPNGAATSYLWERVLQRDNWLQILERFVNLQITEKVDPITGVRSRSRQIIFPRFHQWEAVTSLLETTSIEGPGSKYLIQHSAGSGKTNSIAWLAHGLANLHNADNSKTFDSVIVVTDRTVLDDQLQKAIKAIEGTKGVVGTINADSVRRASATSKSDLLAKELSSGKLIIIVTLQTFPFVLDALAQQGGLADRKFAVVADEAHSSQTGTSAQKLRQVLSQAEVEALEDGGEVSVEDVLAAEMAARATAQNISFYAFTATPKGKTLEMFGRPGTDGLPQPFHVYTMQQAIEEGFILDVLRNYTTYKTAFQLAQKAGGAVGGEDLVDEGTAKKGLMRWVSLHPTNIAQKVQIIVEHFRENVAELLDGHAKAMVVTSSRAAALKYKMAIDAYVEKHNYRLGTLVAFSGSLTAEQIDDFVPGVQEPYTETNMNPDLRGRGIPQAFAGDQFQVLIVANKYQTGFDQPLLCAMYVDKRIDGIEAVQTLSRLNRTLPSKGKDTTYILDFVNDTDTILDAFLPYYRTAEIIETTDPDLVHDLARKLEIAGIYTKDDVDAFAQAFIIEKKHGKHTAPLKQAVDRFNDRYVAALADNTKAEIDELDLFRKDVGSFVRLYDFLSQVIDYQDTDLEKLALFLRLLRPRLTGRKTPEELDFNNIELTHIKQTRQSEGAISLGGDSEKLKPMGVGGGRSRDPHLVAWEEILNNINSLFEDEDFDPSSVESWVQGVVTILVQNEEIKDQVNANTKEQFRESQTIETAVTNAVLDHQDSQQNIMEKFFESAHRKGQIIKEISDLVYWELRHQAEKDT